MQSRSFPTSGQLLTLFTIGLAILSIGIGCLGVKNLGIVPGLDARQLEMGGIIAGAAGVLLILIAFVLFVLKVFIHARKLTRDAFAKQLEYEFKQFTPSAADLPAIIQLMEDCMGRRRTATLEILSRYQEINKRFFTCVRKDVAPHKLEGFILVLPVKKTGHELIERGVIKNGRQFTRDYISKRPSDAYAIYIADLVARSHHSKAFVLYLLKRWIKETYGKDRKLVAIHARPGTPDGMRLIHKYGFSPISDDSEIWSLPYTDLVL
jgi:hypothetical protein